MPRLRSETPDVAPASPWDPTSPAGRVLRAVDDAGDRLVEPLRGRPLVDAWAAAVSNLSDYGFLWVALAARKGARRGPARRRAVLRLAAAGVTSYTVNRAVKRLVGRERPLEQERNDPPVGIPVRRPTSSSFPSGHVLAAYCTALVLPDSPPETVACLAFATSVAVSRVHLRAHHASDVVAGAVIGTAAGLGVSRMLDAAAGTRSSRGNPACSRAGGME